MPVALSMAPGVAVDASVLEADAQVLLEVLGLTDAELSLFVTDDAGITSLNRDWLGHDDATDVLSFPQQSPPGQAGVPRLLGDIVISVETARRQAQSCGHGLGVELRVLLVHGLCHLCGFDHQTPADAAIMAAQEAKLLAALASGNQALTGLISRVNPQEHP